MPTGDMTQRKLLGMLGLCRKAGKLTLGTELTCLAMAERTKPRLIVASEGASAGTAKKIRTKTAFYGIPLLIIPASPEALGAALGKGSIACCAVHDGGFATQLIRIESTGKESSASAEERI